MITIFGKQFHGQNVANLQKVSVLTGCTLLALGLISLLHLEHSGLISNISAQILCTTGSLLLFATLCIQCMKRKVDLQTPTIPAIIQTIKVVPEASQPSHDASMCKDSIFDKEGPLGDLLRAFLVKAGDYISGAKQLTPLQNRQIGIMMGGAVGDALGSGLEFMPYKKSGYEKPGEKLHMTRDAISGVSVNVSFNHNRYNLSPGQWTDDTAMALCLADSLLENEGNLIGTKIIAKFIDWSDHGLNNGTAIYNPGPTTDVGRQIAQALSNYKKATSQTAGSYRAVGDQNASGNGSLMRLGPIVLIAKTTEKAMELACEQSYITHSGIEAADCSQLMAGIMHLLLTCPDESPMVRKQRVLHEMQTKITGLCETVQSLAKSEISRNRKTGKPENWNWKSGDFDFNQERSGTGVTGGYAMDALAMALHCIWTTETFEDAVRKAASRGGDADTVAAITGQIAGALYGYETIPQDWRNAVHKHDRNGEIMARALALSKEV